jgi:CBS-domain-containing membrane protein
MRFMALIDPWRGGGTVPPRAPIGRVLRAGAGGTIALALIGLLAGASGLPLILGSFGATCVLVFGFPESPFSQPRSVIGGHVLASAIGLLVLHGIGDGPWCLALATGLAIAAMMALRVVHPPAGSNPVIVFLLHAPWSFLHTPTMIGAVIVVVCALLWHRATLRGKYPLFW